MKRTAKEIQRACGGKIYNCDKDTEVNIFVNNNNKIVKKCVYVAIKGEKYDGMDFAKDAIKRGASLVICDRIPSEAYPCIVVDDVLVALEKIAAYYRKKELNSVVAVTGSYGKTTVKELCTSVLCQKFRVLKTLGNKNNLIGLPLTVLSEHQGGIAVLEAGISEVGEMERLSSACAPDTVIITGIGLTHGETLGSREDIAREKLKILSYASGDAVLIIPENEPLLKDNGAKKVKTVALESETADYSAYNLRFTEEGTFFDVKRKGIPCVGEIFVPIIGSHGAFDALLAIAAADIYKLGEKDIRKGLSEYKPAENRQNITVKNGVIIMADCYNFGPEAARASLAAFDTLARKKGADKTVLCLGSMLELGMISESEHIALGKEIAAYGFDALITVGELAKNIALGAYIGGMSNEKLHIFSDNERSEAGQRLKELAIKGSAVLIKGSRKLKMEEFIPLIG